MAIETIVKCDNCNTVKINDRKEWYGASETYAGCIMIFRISSKQDQKSNVHLCSEQCYREYLTRFFTSPSKTSEREGAESTFIGKGTKEYDYMSDSELNDRVERIWK